MCGRRGTFGTFIDVRGSSATTVDPWTPTVFYVAGVTLSAPQARCVWQAWHFRYLHRCPRKLGDDGGPMDADCLLRGRRDTFSTAGAMCVAGVALSVPFHLPHINLSNHVIQEALHDARNQVPISTGQ